MLLRTKLGGLECVVAQAQENVKPKHVVLFCHGFGAPGDDLVPLYDALRQLKPVLDGVRFYFPAGTHDLAALGMPGARAWWIIDEVIRAQMQMGNVEALAEYLKRAGENVKPARQVMLKCVDEVLRETGLETRHLILGGFSQGAMLATDVALHLEEAVGGLVALSGALLLENVWREKLKKRESLSVFQSHGKSDPILKFELGYGFKKLCDELGVQNEFIEFQGGHEIPIRVLAKLGDFLEKKVS